MIVRDLAGGIVFHSDMVLLIRNDKQEWSFPKGEIKSGADAKISAQAAARVEFETGVKCKVIAPCSKTTYEFYSIKRKKPVHNNVSWFVMSTEDGETSANEEAGIEEAVFVKVEKALDMITYSQDKSLMMLAYQRWKELV